MPGTRIRHTGGLANVCYTVPVVAKPYTTGPIDCPTCGVLHPLKTVHLWLEPDGTCIVADGVLNELRMAGMPQLETVNRVENPPPLQLGDLRPVVKDTVSREADVRARREWRAGVDKKNRAIDLLWSRIKGKQDG